MSDGAASIARLRAVAAHLVEGNHPEAAWFAARLSEYEAGAPFGLQLGAAFGLHLAPGAQGWWESEARAKRDALIRAMR
ncbi:MAG: hypothetical protein ACRD3Q_20805, partial [Terriglobales bacterium]